MSSGWSQSTLAVRLFRELMGVRTVVLKETHKRMENTTLRESLGILSSVTRKLLGEQTRSGGYLCVCVSIQEG